MHRCNRLSDRLHHLNLILLSDSTDTGVARSTSFPSSTTKSALFGLVVSNLAFVSALMEVSDCNNESGGIPSSAPPVGPATAGTIKLVTITGGDDGIPPDLLLQSETHISSKTNARFETAKPNKADFVVEEGKKVNLATPVSVESESKMEVQTTESVAETVTPVQKVNRSVEVNIKRPSWLPEDWKFEKKVRTNGASAGAVDNVEVVSETPSAQVPIGQQLEKVGNSGQTITSWHACAYGLYLLEFRRILATGKQSWIGTTFGDKRRLVEEQLLAVSLQWLYHSSRAKEMESGDRIELDGSSVVKGVLKPWSEAQTVLSASPHLMCALVSSSRF
ncbi:hypothetical protein T459_28557 [Capsicum annuum]|uniref:Uncharacterized protein n=1 Tax=Capsicum annuum TaxID=4072 RepID=A0A2G2YH70_CAPAN|nr:hypothetical protein T459_28557 [Capsicum annuum]